VAARNVPVRESDVSDLSLRLFDIAIALAGALGGWVLNSVRQSVRDLQEADRVLTDKVMQIEVLVAGNYVNKDELRNVVEDIKRTLLRIETKLDHKVDRQGN
jgi:hypothetical protein